MSYLVLSINQSINQFLARDSICVERAICYRNSVCLSHGWISPKNSKAAEVRIMQFSPYSSPSL